MLHRLASCFVVPSIDYFTFSFMNTSVPRKSQCDQVCTWCAQKHAVDNVPSATETRSSIPEELQVSFDCRRASEGSVVGKNAHDLAVAKVEEDPSKEKRSRGQFRREVETLRKEVSADRVAPPVLQK